jgi:hypothetical protein
MDLAHTPGAGTPRFSRRLAPHEHGACDPESAETAAQKTVVPAPPSRDVDDRECNPEVCAWLMADIIRMPVSAALERS